MTSGAERGTPLRRFAWAAAAACCAAAACAEDPEPPPSDAPPESGVHGRVHPAVGQTPSVVTLEPAVPVEVDRPPVEVDQLGLQFSPRLVLAAPGRPVTFTNSESLAHNVTVRSVADGSTVLNQDTPPNERFSHAFDEEGAYDVGCDVHPGMSAFIFVTSAPYAAFADADGAFRIPHAPPGSYTLRVWSSDPAGLAERAVTVSPGVATEVVTAPSG